MQGVTSNLFFGFFLLAFRLQIDIGFFLPGGELKLDAFYPFFLLFLPNRTRF